MTDITRKVLCVDDDPGLLDGLKRQLRRKFDLAFASSGAEALEVLASSGPFAVVVTDYTMPKMNGVELLREVRSRCPDVVTVMLTGHSELDVAVSALHEGHIFRFLNKPCPSKLLESTIGSALEQYRLIVSEQRLKRELADANAQLRVVNDDLEVVVSARTSEIRRLCQFVTELNGLDGIDEVAEVVAKTTAEMLESERVSLMVPQKTGEYLGILASIGLPDGLSERVRVPIGSGIAGHVFSSAESIVVNDPVDLPLDGERYDDTFFASVPLVSSLLYSPSGPIGVLNVTGHLDRQPYGPEHLAMLRAISEAASIALCNQRRLAERNEARDAIILALAKLAECRDPETGQHLERVRNYCRLLCRQLATTPQHRDMSRRFIDSMFRSSPLHDIGKVGIPDAILLKPGRLTPEEFEIMKRHATIGGDTIRSIIAQGRSQDFLQVGMEIAYSHHEKFDGSGYPNGRAGEAIPLSARIMAVADVYDALTSKRVYKPAFSHEKACSIIRDDAGKHFDPLIVEVFLREEGAFARLAVELADALPPASVSAAEPVELATAVI